MNERNPILNKLSFLNYKTGNVLLQSLFGQLLSLAHSVGNSNLTNAFFPTILLEQITFLLGTIIHDIFTNSSHSQKLFLLFHSHFTWVSSSYSVIQVHVPKGVEANIGISLQQQVSSLTAIFSLSPCSCNILSSAALLGKRAKR